MFDWLLFFGLVFGILVYDFKAPVKTNQDGSPEIGGSAIRTAVYVMCAIAFGAYIWIERGGDRGAEFFTGYALEMALSLDNVFVIGLIFTAMGIPAAHQHKALFWGVGGALVLRGIFIGAGTALVAEFEWLLILFGAFLLYTGVKLIASGDQQEGVDLESNRVYKLLMKTGRVFKDHDNDDFFVKVRGPHTDYKWKLMATPLFVAVIMIELADLLFAVDSIPATLAVTTDTFIVYSSNILAIVGLRSLFFVLQAAVNRFEYLGKVLSIVLIFIGAKIIAAETIDFHLPTLVSLGVVLALLTGGVLFSLYKTRGHNVA